MSHLSTPHCGALAQAPVDLLNRTSNEALRKCSGDFSVPPKFAAVTIQRPGRPAAA